MSEVYDVVVTGSEGLLGKFLVKYLTDLNYKVGCLDKVLGHDLGDEKFVKYWFQENKSKSLVNLFAQNHTMNIGEVVTNLDNIELVDFNSMLKNNLTDLFSVCRQFVINNAYGNVVNMSSIYGITSPIPKLYENGEKNIAYGISKAGVIQLTKHFAIHKAPEFRFNSIILGGVEDKQSKKFIADYSREVPLGRMARPSEIGPLIELLISEKSSYITGSTFCVDGGWTAW